MRRIRWTSKVVGVCLAWSLWSVAPCGRAAAAGDVPAQSTPWQQLIREARSMGLPTNFLHDIPGDFVTIQFEDLHTYAAEYHPEDHRMVLNRTLSFNAAGSVLRPLRTLHHRDIGTLYHELFHAYMDYLVADSAATAQPDRRRQLLSFARNRQVCRYADVDITPVVQRKGATERRALSEVESWEALNETWAVFVGWAVWTKLESEAAAKGRGRNGEGDWFARLGKANERGELRGYYEPEDKDEQALTKKRYLAHRFRITPEEGRALLELIMEVSSRKAKQAGEVLEKNREALEHGLDCASYPIDSTSLGKK